MGLPKKVLKLFLLARKKLLKNNYNVALFGSIIVSWALIESALIYNIFNFNPNGSILGINTSDVQTISESILTSPVSEITPSPTVKPSLTPTPTITIKTKRIFKKIKPTPTNYSQIDTNYTQYTAEKISDVTWKVKNVQNDNSMASASDIINALNSYRGERGIPNMLYDSNLSSFAQERANLFNRNHSLDQHAGFRSYMDNGGFDKSGFNSLGENSAYLSGPMGADKIVRSIFGADASHDGNQLDNWTHIGVGVNGNTININFGKNKK